jgi:hypothetical protein
MRPALTEQEHNQLVLELQKSSPLGQISNMEARVVFERLQQRGWKIVPPEASHG